MATGWIGLRWRGARASIQHPQATYQGVAGGRIVANISTAHKFRTLGKTPECCVSTNACAWSGLIQEPRRAWPHGFPLSLMPKSAECSVGGLKGGHLGPSQERTTCTKTLLHWRSGITRVNKSHWEWDWWSYNSLLLSIPNKVVCPQFVLRSGLTVWDKRYSQFLVMEEWKLSSKKKQ